MIYDEYEYSWQQFHADGRTARKGKPQKYGQRFGEESYRCIHCKADVIISPLLSGVQNRNHCPYCLWSKHVDLWKAGDRLAACKAAMEPVGLSVKRANKKYVQSYSGELMLVHRCLECGCLVLNRVAADDSADALFRTYQRSWQLDAANLERASRQGIVMLGQNQQEFVCQHLFGREWGIEENQLGLPELS